MVHNAASVGAFPVTYGLASRVLIYPAFPQGEERDAKETRTVKTKLRRANNVWHVRVQIVTTTPAKTGIPVKLQSGRFSLPALALLGDSDRLISPGSQNENFG